MIKIFVYFNLMVFFFMAILSWSLVLFYMDYSILFEWLMISVNSVNIEFMVLIDWVSLLFVSIIFLISSMIMMYSYAYMMGEENIERFIYLVVLFGASMILMIMSPNILSILFGWDGLGLTSYCLVIFYQNNSSYNSGMVTVLCNRVGDVGLLMGISLFMVSGSWNLWMFKGHEMLIILMLVLAAITKSAQIPFSSWLPMAMAAPTPVSALVHSSTLVTAGVYLMIRFNEFLILGSMSKILFFLSVLTMFMSGLMANVEIDLKKIIALSTLSQLGLMMMVLSAGFKMMAFYHLLTHAIFKSMLFMCAGAIIHLMMNNQDIRLFGNLNEIMPFTMMSFFISSMALCGFPFMAGFYSKDYIMELIYSNEMNFFMLFMITVSLMLTVSYTFRIMYYMFFSDMKFYSYYGFEENSLMSIAMMILVIMSIILGSMMSWVFFFDFNLIYLKISVKMVSLGMCLMGGLLGVWVGIYKILINYYYLNFYLSSMWFLNYSYLWVYGPINLLGVEFYEFDKMWVEFSSKGVISHLMKQLNYYKMYNIYQFMYLYILLFLLIIVFF